MVTVWSTVKPWRAKRRLCRSVTMRWLPLSAVEEGETAGVDFGDPQPTHITAMRRAAGVKDATTGAWDPGCELRIGHMR